MQTISSLNFYVAKAILHTIENLDTILKQAHELTTLIADSEKPVTLNFQPSLCTNLTNLIHTANNYTKNLELTLLEELQIIIDHSTADADIISS